MKKILTIALFALAVNAQASSSWIKPDAPKVTKAVLAQQPRDIVGLGISYNWPQKNYALLTEELAKAGCNATDIEYMGLTVSTQHGYRKGGADALKNDYLKLLTECRKRNITLIVSIVNDNMHQKKWLQSGVHDLAHWPQECERAAQIVMEAGPANVWVQVIAETQTSQGRAYQSRWLPKFKAAGFKTVYNDGSRPGGNDGAWTRAYHSCKLSDLGNGSNILLIPDCGTAIDQYTDMGIPFEELTDEIIETLTAEDLFMPEYPSPNTTAGNFNTGKVVNPAVAASFVRRGRAKGNGVCIYTGTGIESVEAQIPAIKAIGAAK